MELLDKGLDKLVVLDMVSAWNIGKQLIQCLKTLHQEGIMHRDIKPLNLMLNSQGSLRLIDFGCATDTCDQMIVGTKVYGSIN